VLVLNTIIKRFLIVIVSQSDGSLLLAQNEHTFKRALASRERENHMFAPI